MRMGPRYLQLILLGVSALVFLLAGRLGWEATPFEKPSDQEMASAAGSGTVAWLPEGDDGPGEVGGNRRFAETMWGGYWEEYFTICGSALLCGGGLIFVTTFLRSRRWCWIVLAVTLLFWYLASYGALCTVLRIDD